MSISKLISVDWGTSNLRIKSINPSSVSSETIYYGKHGIKAIDLKWQEQHERARDAFFLEYLESEIKEAGLPIDGNSVIFISGMASSSIGIKELKYAPLPFSCDGSGLRIATIPHESHAHIHLISGIKADADVMRGEETQLIGLQKDLPDEGKNMIILPGTHSKHVEIVDGNVTDFQTFLTGELFDVISKHTILKNSLECDPSSSENLKSFQHGVTAAAQGQFLRSLFKIRANDLLSNQTRSENYNYLSGLLLGLELMGLQGSSANIYLAGVEPLSTLYHKAARILDIDLHLIPIDRVQRAVIDGHLQIYKSSILH